MNGQNNFMLLLQVIFGSFGMDDRDILPFSANRSAVG